MFGTQLPVKMKSINPTSTTNTIFVATVRVSLSSSELNGTFNFSKTQYYSVTGLQDRAGKAGFLSLLHMVQYLMAHEVL
jgi:hypothetical protein